MQDLAVHALLLDAVRRGELVLRTGHAFDGVKVFSELVPARSLIDSAAAWLVAHPELDLVEVTVLTSGEGAAACTTIAIAFRRDHEHL
jgi:hypothetical protein